MAAARKTTNTTSTAKADDTKAEDVKTDEAKTEAPKTEAPKASTAPKADDVKADDQAADAEDLKSFVDDDRSTQEKVDDPEVTNVVPAHYDPAVNAADEQASHAAQARVEDTKKAVRFQVRQFDTSEFGGDVLDALDSKDSKDDDKK